MLDSDIFFAIIPCSTHLNIFTGEIGGVDSAPLSVLELEPDGYEEMQCNADPTRDGGTDAPSPVGVNKLLILASNGM